MNLKYFTVICFLIGSFHYVFVFTMCLFLIYSLSVAAFFLHECVSFSFMNFVNLCFLGPSLIRSDNSCKPSFLTDQELKHLVLEVNLLVLSCIWHRNQYRSILLASVCDYFCSDWYWYINVCIEHLLLCCNRYLCCFKWEILVESKNLLLTLVLLSIIIVILWWHWRCDIWDNQYFCLSKLFAVFCRIFWFP